jgi:hypothetical protein
MISGLITPWVFLNYYGSQMNGLISSISQLIALLVIIEAGITHATVNALYKPLAENHHRKINGILSAANLSYKNAGYLFLLFVFITGTAYAFYIQVDFLSNPLYIIIIAFILGANAIMEFFVAAKYRVLLAADQRTYLIASASLIHTMIYTIMVVLMGTMKVNIVVLLLISYAAIIIKPVILVSYARRNYKYLDLKEAPDRQALHKRWDALYLQILGTIQQTAPIVILTVTTKNLMIVSVYTIFNMVLIGINGLTGIFTQGLYASFGDVLAKGETGVLKKAYKEFELFYYSIIAVVFSVAFISIMPFIQLYTKGVNDIDYNNELLGFLFVLNGLLYNLKNPQGMLVISAGLFKETKWQTTIQGIILVAVGFALAPYYGIVGVLIGAILSNLYRDIDLLIFIPKKVTKLPIRNSVYRILGIFLVVLALYVTSSFVDVNSENIYEWVYHACMWAAFAFLVVLTLNLIFERDSFMGIVKRIGIVLKK